MSLIEVAKIVKPQGIRGEVKAQISTNVNAVFKGLKEAYVEGNILEISSISLRQGFLYIKFEGIDDRNKAETLRGKRIMLDKDFIKNALEEDELLVDDLIGMVLYDKEGNLVGQIVDVENYGATFNFIIDCNGRTVQTPFVDGVFERDGDTLVVNKDKFDEVSVW